MTWRQMLKIAEEVTAATIAELPGPVRERLAAIPILMERWPSPEDTRSGIEPDTLGYFDESDPGFSRIRLWLDNIFDFAAGDPETFGEEVKTTLLHEIGHALGWDEDEVEDRGLG